MQHQSIQTIPIFVNKLYQILNEDDFDGIIGWLENDKEFEILSVEGLESNVLPKYFRHNKVNSFIRQLNMYGFHKSRKDPSKTVFSHPQFIKGHSQNLPKIQRRSKADPITQGNETIKSQIDSTFDQISKPVTIKVQDSDMLSQMLENNAIKLQKNQLVEENDENNVDLLDGVNNQTLWVIEDEKEFVFGEEKGPSTLKCFMDKSIVFDHNPDVYSPKQYRVTVDNQDAINMNDCQSDDDGTSLAGDIQMLEYENKIDDSVKKRLFEQ